MSTRDLILAHLRDEPTIGLRELGKAAGGVSRTAAQRAVRELVAAGTLRVTRVGTCAEFPSTYAVVE